MGGGGGGGGGYGALVLYVLLLVLNYNGYGLWYKSQTEYSSEKNYFSILCFSLDVMTQQIFLVTIGFWYLFKHLKLFPENIAKFEISWFCQLVLSPICSRSIWWKFFLNVWSTHTVRDFWNSFVVSFYHSSCGSWIFEDRYWHFVLFIANIFFFEESDLCNICSVLINKYLIFIIDTILAFHVN